jgi:hydroxyacyl-ACP dehydratase HTD2-like protein with hotdog domain
MKLNRSNIENMKQRNFKLCKRKPNVKGLNDNPIHKKIMGRILVNYSDKLLNVHMLHYDITLLTGTRQLDGSPKGVDAIRRVKF